MRRYRQGALVVALPSRVLVAGSAGFIGRVVATELRSAGVAVVDAGRQNGVDLTSWDSVSALPPCGAIVHLAGRTYVPDSFADPLPFFHDNVVSTLHLLEHARRNGSAFVLASAYVYGRPLYLPIDESHPVSAGSPYTASKIMAEDLCRAYHRDFRMPLVILRIFNVYGAGQRSRFLVPTIVNGLRDGTVRLGDAAPRRDFVHVDDVAGACLAALRLHDSDAEAFNIASGRSVSVGELVDMLGRLSGCSAAVHYTGVERRGEIADVVADIGKAARLLGWAPRVDLETGLQRTLDAAWRGWTAARR
jgi:UDP-glucose 4-epimerase